MYYGILDRKIHDVIEFHFDASGNLEIVSRKDIINISAEDLSKIFHAFNLKKPHFPKKTVEKCSKEVQFDCMKALAGQMLQKFFESLRKGGNKS